MERLATATTLSIPVSGIDQASEVRRNAQRLAASAGFDEVDAGRVALVAAEAATNVAKHASEGEVLLNSTNSGAPAIEILATDKGPGMPDVSLCLRDGYSTAGSADTGLGAIQRLSNQCEIYSAPGRGTVLLARIWPRKQATPGTSNRAAIGAVSVPLRGEPVCGDGWAAYWGDGFVNLLVVDGLGHGYSAAECARAALSAFAEDPTQPPHELIQAAHAASRSTRGGAAAAARLDERAGIVRFAGIGNVAGQVAGKGRAKQMISHPGIVGHDVRLVREFTYDWRTGDLVLLYSDGLSTHWAIDSYEGLAGRDPSLIAATLYRDWSRRRDDATVVVCKSEE